MYAILKNWQGSPRRFNEYLRIIRNMNAFEAKERLKFVVSPCGLALSKLINSALANASNDSDINVRELVVEHATAGRGKFLKRIKFHGRGKVGRVTKFSSNIVVKLGKKEVK